MQLYKEDEIITISYCNYLHYLDGNINQLNNSQALFKELILRFNFKILEKTLLDVDKFLNLTLKVLIKKHFEDKNTIDDLSYLHTFFTQLFFKYIDLFPSNKFMPAYIDYKPVVKVHDLQIQLNLDLILIQQNKDSFYNLLLFTNDLNEFDLRNNPFNYFKLKFLKNLYNKKKKRFEPVKIHFICTPEPTFRNRNQRDYKLKNKTLDITYYKDTNIKNYDLFFKNFKQEKPIPRFSCNQKNCIKRKECLNAHLR